MKIKKAHLETIFLTLRGTDGVLSLADARVRDAFMKPLGVELDSMYADRTKIYEKFCTKKPDGTPDTEDGNYHFDKSVAPEADKELKTLMEEEAEIELKWGVTPIKLIEIINASTHKPKYGETEIIDGFIESLVKEKAPKKK